MEKKVQKDINRSEHYFLHSFEWLIKGEGRLKMIFRKQNKFQIRKTAGIQSQENGHIY